MTTPKIVVLKDKYVPSPESDSDTLPRDADGNIIFDVDSTCVRDLRAALTENWPTDAHFAAYEAIVIDGFAPRLASGALHELTVRMAVMVGDIDHAESHANGTPAPAEWRQETQRLLETTGLAYYATRGGYRVLAPLQTPFELTSPDHAVEWTARYKGWCDSMYAEYGLELDRATVDWTRLYRLPNVVRDGKPTSARVGGRWRAIELPEASAAAEPAPRKPSHDGPAPQAPRDGERMTRARVLAERMPPSIEGQGGDEALFKCANELATILGDDADAIESVLTDVFNPRCLPPWPVAKLRREAARAAERQATPEAKHARRAEERARANAQHRNAPGAHSHGGSMGGDESSYRPTAGSDNSSGHEAWSGAQPLLLRARSGQLVLLWEGDDRGHHVIAETVLRNRILELGISDYLPLHNGKKDIPTAKILESATTFRDTAYSYSATRTTYEPAGEGRVLVGFPPCPVKAQYDERVDAWLRALGGPQYERLAVWIASCSQQHIERLAACVILIGKADVGKSMFARAVARTWNTVPASMSLVIERFNGDMLRCPVLLDEEAQLFGSRKLSTKRFRDIVQSTDRAVEGKGKERVQLYGAQRFVVGCNGLSDLRFTDLGGPDVIGALRDRMLVLDTVPRADACREALAALRLPGQYLVDLDRIAAHMAWLGETIVLPVERFVGAGGESDGAILAGHIQEHLEVFESLRGWLASACAKGPWYVHKNALHVSLPELTAQLAESSRGWDLTSLQQAVAPFTVRYVRIGAGALRFKRLWNLDALRITQALGLDPDEIDELVRRLEKDDE
jgi:hypothetical protein